MEFGMCSWRFFALIHCFLNISTMLLKIVSISSELKYFEMNVKVSCYWDWWWLEMMKCEWNWFCNHLNWFESAWIFDDVFASFYLNVFSNNWKENFHHVKPSTISNTFPSLQAWNCCEMISFSIVIIQQMTWL